MGIFKNLFNVKDLFGSFKKRLTNKPPNPSDPKYWKDGIFNEQEFQSDQYDFDQTRSQQERAREMYEGFEANKPKPKAATHQYVGRSTPHEISLLTPTPEVESASAINLLSPELTLKKLLEKENMFKV
jgi:hypothetical protein